MKKIYFLVLPLLVVAVTLIGFSHKAYADLSTVSMTPLIEDNDVTNKFQLIVEPGTRRVIRISITDFGNAAKKLSIQPVNATTSTGGKILFQKAVPAGTNGLKYSFASDISDKNNTTDITLKAQTTKDISLALNIPQKSFDGLILGGYTVFEKVDGGLSIDSLNVPVYLTETNKSVGGVLILKNISTGSVNDQPYLFANLSNNQPGLMRKVNVHMNIQRKGLAEFFHLGLKPMEVDQSYANIAPNSTVPIAFNQKQTPVKAGTYVVNGSASSGKTKWKFSGKYHISKAQADKTNKASRNLIYDKTWIFLLVIGGVVILIVAILIAIRMQNRPGKSKTKQK